MDKRVKNIFKILHLLVPVIGMVIAYLFVYSPFILDSFVSKLPSLEIKRVVLWREYVNLSREVEAGGEAILLTPTVDPVLLDDAERYDNNLKLRVKN